MTARNILLAVAGSTPQIITETVWCLARRSESPVHIDTLHIVTTQLAREEIDKLVASDGALAALANDLGQPIPQCEVHVFADEDGRPLTDIRNTSDSSAFATGVTDLVRRLTMDPNSTLYASIAGGRKTMGFLLGQAMSLFARPQDRLSHVLVSPDFEACAGFWYPTTISTPLVNRHGDTIDAMNGDVELANMSFIRLRGRVPASDLRTSVQGPDPIVDRVQSEVDNTNFESRITLELAAILDPRRSPTSTTERPLRKLLAAMCDGSSLTMRIVTVPYADQALRVLFDCVGTGTSMQRASEIAQTLSADLRHVLDLERSGYCLVTPASESEIPSIEREMLLAPDGDILYTQDDARLSSVDTVKGICGVNVGRQYDPRYGQHIPVAALAAWKGAVSMSWRIEKVSLSESQRLAIDTVYDNIRAAPVTASGDRRYDKETVLRDSVLAGHRSELERWRHTPDGFRSTLSLSSDDELPSALIEELGTLAWGGRRFRAVEAGRKRSVNPNILDISDSFCREKLPPFDIPPRSALKTAGLPVARQAAPRGISLDGSLFGHSNSRPVRIDADDRARHLYVLGSTGTGKSTLLRNLIIQDMAAGENVFVMDPHGDLYDELLHNIPKKRLKDTILLDAGNLDHPFGLNFLEVDPSHAESSAGIAMNDLLVIFKRLYAGTPEGFGPVFEQYFRIAMILLMNGPTSFKPSLLDIPRLFNDRSFRLGLLEKITNPQVSDLLETAQGASGDASWKNVSGYITSKFNRFTLDPLIRNLCCQSTSTVSFRDLVDRKHITLVRLPKGHIDEINVRMLGMLIVGKLFGAAMTRVKPAKGSLSPIYVYIDEFQNFVTDSLGQVMAEARKFGLHLTLANQNLAQVDKNTRDTILGNAANLLAFRTGPADARLLEPYFEPSLDHHDLLSLPNFQCAARILNQGVPVMPAFVMQSDPPRDYDGPRASERTLLKRSRESYTRTREEVEAEFAAREAEITAEDKVDKRERDKSGIVKRRS